MNTGHIGVYEKGLHHRLLALGMSDEEFLRTFFERWGRDIRGSLEGLEARNPAHYDDMLESWIETAENDYHHWFMRSGRVQEGDIPPKKPPKKKRRARNPKDIAGVWERQAALGRYLAGVALEDKDIVGFRRTFLSGRLLSVEEALIFLSSPSAAAAGSRSMLTMKQLRINPLERILDTDYRVEEGQGDSGPYRKLIWGPRRTSTIGHLGTTPTELIFPGDVVTSDTLRGLRLREGRIVVFPHPRQQNRFVLAAENSVIAHMTSIVERSLEGYPISLEMGVWFILTGEFVTIDPLRIHYRTIRRPELLGRTTITLEVESWLPPEEVLEQYRHAQDQILGGTPRSLKRKSVALFDFVNQHKEKSWRELFDAWNEAHPRQRFKDRSHLYTTYRRALDNIAAPGRVP
jgi:hypothetical protein